MPFLAHLLLAGDANMKKVAAKWWDVIIQAVLTSGFHLECLRLKSVPIDQNHGTFKTVAKMRSSKRVNKSMTINII